MRSAQSMLCFLRRVTEMSCHSGRVWAQKDRCQILLLSAKKRRGWTVRSFMHIVTHGGVPVWPAMDLVVENKEWYIYTCTYYIILYIYILFNVIHMICVWYVYVYIYIQYKQHMVDRKVGNLGHSAKVFLCFFGISLCSLSLYWWICACICIYIYRNKYTMYTYAVMWYTQS